MSRKRRIKRIKKIIKEASQNMDIFEIANQAKDKAKSFLQKDGKVQPVIICFTPTEQAIIPLTFSQEEKLKVMAAIKKIMEVKHVWAYIQINEGWMVKGSMDKPVDLNIKPSQHPDNIKVLTVSAVTRKRSKMWAIPVERMHGIVMFGKEKILDTQDGSWKIGGLFFSLLSKLH